MKGALLISTYAFWAAQLVGPVLNHYLPALYVTEYAYPVSVGNILTPVFGFLSLLSVCCLYKTTTPIQNSRCREVTFLVFLYLTVGGHAAHLVCVVIEDAGAHVHPLVFVLHERVSHNIFQLGFYGMMALLLWREVGVAASNERPRQRCGAGTSATFAALIGRLAGCILLGAFFSIFAVETATQVVTMAFYVLCLTAIAFATRSLGIGGVWRMYARSELLICGVLTQVALAGMTVMAAY